MKPENLKDRTNQKLNFARIHLAELEEMSSSRGAGSDWERAHHEAFVAQLFGAYYAFLLELNQYLGCGLPEDDVNVGKMRKALKTKGIKNAILKYLYLRAGKNKNEEDWFLILKDMRITRRTYLAFHSPTITRAKPRLSIPQRIKNREMILSRLLLVGFQRWND
jgi:hypothetical protein